MADLGKKLGSESISVLVDNTSQLQAARVFMDIAGFRLKVFIKVDTGYHRAGVMVGTEHFNRLMADVLDEEFRGVVELLGFYSHAGHSYGGDSALSAMELLVVELEGLEKAAEYSSKIRDHAPTTQKYVLSVGATPTATSIENMVKRSTQTGSPIEKEIVKLETVIERIKVTCAIEIHAGVYPFLDMQQLATQASPSAISPKPNCHASGLSTADIALTVMAEVASVYGTRDSPEALIAAGSLALGHDPCKSYDGWGIISDWGMLTNNFERRAGESTFPSLYFSTSTELLAVLRVLRVDTLYMCRLISLPKEGNLTWKLKGWQVGRISQEHGILTKESQHESQELAELKVGQKVRVWPNHACVAGAGFGWYLVVDSSLPEDRRDQIVDVWVRCRGW